MHGQNGSIFQHFLSCHNEKPSRDQLTKNTTIIARAKDRYRLSIKEALLILNYTPSLNIQFDNFSNTLKLYNHRNKQSVITKSKCADTLPNQPCEDPSEHPPSPHLKMNTLPSCPALNVVTSHPEVLAETLEKNLTSKIKDSQEGLPDFEAILLRFGIDYKKLKCIPLKNYLWWTFDDTKEEYGNMSPTISQRVKSMVRGARMTQSLAQT